MAHFHDPIEHDIVTGTSGNDTLHPMASGGDTLEGGLGDDTYYVDSAFDLVVEHASEGVDEVVSQVDSYTLTDNVENLRLDPQAIFYAPIATNGIGNAMDNLITGNQNWNLLDGQGGNDRIYGLDGNDTLIGGAGRDTLDGGAGDDSMSGGIGDDVYIVDSARDIVVEAFNQGTDRVEASVNFTLAPRSWVENLTLTGTNAVYATGNTSNNLIVGNAAANVLDGGSGHDTMIGGAGNDRYLVDSTADVVTEAANAGYDTVVAGVSWTLGANVEKLDQFAAVGNVNGTGNAAANTMIGNNADNLLQGLGGADTMLGSAGMDTLEGGQGGDTLRGGDGIDHLRAVDNFTAADSATDLFVFDTTPNSVTNYDYIDWANFVAGETSKDDQIELDHTVFGALTSSSSTTPTLGTLNASEFFSGAGSTGGALQDAVGIYQNTSNGYLYYNPTEGVGGDSVLFAVLQPTAAGGGSGLGAEEFTLI